MQITLTKEQVKEAFGELRYMGADYCYRYDKETRKKTEEVEALRLHLGSMKLGNSVDIRLEATELPKIEPYSVVELENAVYDPYVMRGNYPTLVERVTCKGIRTVSGKSAWAVTPGISPRTVQRERSGERFRAVAKPQKRKGRW